MTLLERSVTSKPPAQIEREIAEVLEVVAARLANILTDPAFVHARRGPSLSNAIAACVP